MDTGSHQRIFIEGGDHIVYSPVIIPTLCRYDHLRRGLESLAANTWAKYTDVYIAVDYPKDESHRDGYEKICTYLAGNEFNVFHSFNVIFRDRNYGAYINCQKLVDDIIDIYDRWIFAEDDIVFSPVFIEYMDKCLEEYRDDERILAVNGYSYPLPWRMEQGATVLFQSAAFSAWGEGHWKNKYLLAKERLSAGFLYNNYEYALRGGLMKKFIKARYYDYTAFLLSAREDGQFLRRPSDIALGIYMGFTNQTVVTPVISQTRNMGFDGSGLYCGNIRHKTNKHSQAYDYENQETDTSTEFIVKPDSNIDNKTENERLLDHFLYVPIKEKITANIFLILYRIFGKEKCGDVYVHIKRAYKGIKKKIIARI